MLTLFKKFKDAGKITEAILIGENLLNRNSGNEYIFDEYFSYLYILATSLPSLEERQMFIEKANIALAFYKENAELDEIKIEHILNYQNKIDSVYENIYSLQNEENKLSLEKLQIKNSDYIEELYILKDELKRASSKKLFENKLEKIRNIDELVDKTILTKEHNLIYDALTKELTELISDKMREIERNENVEYNKRALRDFEKAFKLFKNNESTYKNKTQLFSLVSTTLFAHDPSRLFNETLIWYNNVYSYIFNKLDDEGKIELTKYSIECERVRVYDNNVQK